VSCSKKDNSTTININDCVISQGVVLLLYNISKKKCSKKQQRVPRKMYSLRIEIFIVVDFLIALTILIPKNYCKYVKG
jgi:hypothetical protein